MNDKGWTRHFDRIGDAYEEACIETAKMNGHTIEESENCDNGSVGCPDCPFKIK